MLGRQVFSIGAEVTADEETALEQLSKELAQARQRIAELELLEQERRRAEDAVRESERKIRAVLDQTFQFIGLLEPDGTLIEANRSSLEFGGLEESDVIGKKFWDTPWWSHSTELQLRLQEGMQRALTGELFRFEAYHPGPDGEIHYFDVSLKPVVNEHDEVIYVIPEGHDITERKRAEKELHRLALALENSGELVNMATMDGMMVFLNGAGCRMLGIDPDEVETINIMQVIPDHLTELVNTKLLPALLRGETWKGELQYRNLKTGKLTDVHAVTYPVPDPESGELLYLANVSLDMTEQKWAETERQHLEAQVRHMQKLESLGVLAGGIAHDFNNLLTGILGNAELALMEVPESSPARANLVGIERAAVRAADLCRQMLAYSGRGRFVIESLDLPGIVMEMAHMLEVSISKKVQLTYNLMGNVPPVEADATQLRQIILNLITNASESIEGRGEITLSVGVMECDRSYLSGAFIDETLPAGTYSYLQVTDTGIGMDEETIAKVFDPFFSTKFAGRGLGLSAVLGIIRGHRGAIKVDSVPGGGSTFRILLPAVEGVSIRQRHKPPVSPSWRGQGLVLLVDDEEAVRSVAGDMLRQAGFTVVTASDGCKAVTVFKEHLDEIVLVLLDLTMPAMDGEETLRELHRLKRDMPVILCSGYDEQDATCRFEAQELAGFLKKPFTREELMTLLQGLPQRVGQPQPRS
jgi:PAS domain S-box-containing protein